MKFVKRKAHEAHIAEMMTVLSLYFSVHLKFRMIEIWTKAETLKTPVPRWTVILRVSRRAKIIQKFRGPNTHRSTSPMFKKKKAKWHTMRKKLWISEITWNYINI